MGQSTYGIMYGVRRPAGIDMYGEDGYGGIVGQWRDHCAAEIEAYDREHPRKSWRDPEGEDLWIPQDPYEGLDIVGFYVAVGASGKPGIPDLGSGFAFGEVADAIPEGHKQAVMRWQRFADWAATMGIVFDPAQLFLTACEVA